MNAALLIGSASGLPALNWDPRRSLPYNSPSIEALLAPALPGRDAGILELRRAFGLARHLLKDIYPRNEDGFTVDRNSGEPPSFQPDWYLVSLRGHGLVVERRPRLFEIFGWLVREWSSLGLPNHYIGHWLSGAWHYLDVSVAIRGEARAMKLAQREAQQSIYYPTEKMCMPVR